LKTWPVPFQSNHVVDEATRKKSNVTWISSNDFEFNAKFFGRDSELDKSGCIEIDLLAPAASCFDGSRCLADCARDQVKIEETFLRC
jgi:hypothetical protein